MMNSLSYRSVPALLEGNAGKYTKKTAISYKKRGVFLSLTCQEFYERVLMLARGLKQAGLHPFEMVRKRFGGKLKYFICGGAPLDKTLNEFMWLIGLPVLNGYGLTETSLAITLSSYDVMRFDSVGKPLDETEVKPGEDGELFVKGPQVMRQYYKNDEVTREALDDDWFRTGDIARINEQGHIIDRKNELIVTAGGKNIVPQPIENEIFRGNSPATEEN